MNRIYHLLAIAMLAIAASAVDAQGFPNKPIHIIVPFPAGGAGDVVPRVIGQHLHKTLGQPVIVENKLGAEGMIGVDAVAKAAPDGYTLGVATSGPVVIGKRLFPNIPYDPKKDLTPLILTYETPFVLVVNADSPARTATELFALAKKSPGKLNAAIPNNGSIQHLLTEMMKSTIGLDIVNIPYKGGAPAAIDVAGGQVDLTWGALPNVIGLIKGNKLRALAVSSAQRTPLLKDVPTLVELGWPTLVATNWNGLIAPAGTPVAVLEKLNGAINAILALPEVTQQFTEMGVTALGGSRQQFATLLADEEKKWAAVITSANIKPE
jgi:tripartite-type tricarboxylate transporter receptor subunit TctC